MRRKVTAITAGALAVLALSAASLAAIAVVGAAGVNASNQGAYYNAMHNSPAMQQAMSQFSPELRAQCNVAHAQMSSFMRSHMNGAYGPGMMGGW